LFEPKRTGPLPSLNFFKAMNPIKLIERGHFEGRFIGRERSRFKENIKLVKNLKNLKLSPFDSPELSFFHIIRALLVLQSF